MVTCSVFDCSVNHRNNPENYTFHRFPKDPLIRTKWLTLIGRVGWNPNKTATICSKHFQDKYKRKSRINTVLVKGAIPTLFVSGTLKERIPTSYVMRDIPSTSSCIQEHSLTLSPTERKILSKNDKLKKKIQEKRKKIRSLVAKNKRQAVKIVTLQDLLQEINSMPELKDHRNDVTMVYSDELIQS